MNRHAGAQASAAPAVTIRGVSRLYKKQRGAGEILALDGVSLDVQAGEYLVLLGPNGSGKSSLLRMIATLDVPTAGEVRVLGELIERSSRKIRARIGVLFQHPSIDPLLSVRENLRTSAALYGLRKAEAADRVTACAEELGIADRLDDRAGALSGGLLRRADLARALIHNPELLILDEPTTGLDPTARRSFMDAIERRRAEHGMTVFMSTHLLDEAERAERIVMLSRGRVVAEGTPAGLRESIGAPRIVRTDAAHAEVFREFGLVARLRSGQASCAAADDSAHAIASRLLELGAKFSVGPPTLEDVYEHFAGDALQPGVPA